ncbi:MAG: cell division protein FtsX, partial [Candidatus Aminicenantaceae bacterium]
MIIVFFLEKDIPKDRINSIENLLQSSPLIDDHHFKSTEKALENFLNNFPDLERVIENLESNPLPPSIEATLKNDILYSDDLTLFLDKMKNTEGIKEVQFNQEWVNKMESFSKLAKAIG